MKFDNTKPWILWEHDPCPEGGWHIGGFFDTQDEAMTAAKKRHEEAFKRHWEMVEYLKKKENDSGIKREWVWGNNCYDGAIVTPNAVFQINDPPPGAKLREDNGGA